MHAAFRVRRSSYADGVRTFGTLLLALVITGCATAPPVGYDGWQRTALYVTARDGTRLAVDLFRPTRGGVLHREPLPVVWTATRYRRTVADESGVYTMLDDSTWLQELLRHGYVVAAVDVRGSGASFGTFQGMFSRQETEDSYDVTEWLGTQPWSTGKVGMYGRSYLGITQYMAASQAPPHLVAIFPEVAMGDLYSLLWPGGISHSYLIEAWTQRLRVSDLDKPAVAVDGPEGEALLRQALEEHRANVSMGDIAQQLRFRDSALPDGVQPYRDWSPLTHREAIGRSGVAIYHLGGWFDRYIREQVVLFRNLPNPQKLVIGPWSHVQDHEFDFGTAHLRFYDRWLKGIDNSIMREPAVQYYTIGAPEGQRWRTAATWPLPQQQPTNWYLDRNGSLTTTRGIDGSDALNVDYEATVAPSPRWSNAATWPDDLSAADARGLHYDSEPLAAPLEVTGHPVVHLWLSADVDDADVFVYLEEVDAAGSSRYVSEGMLRASHRALASPGYDNAGLPYHRSEAADIQPLPRHEPVELVFDLYPTSNIFDAGHRIRLTITGADRANARTPRRDPPARLVFYRDTVRPSHIVLPIIPEER